MDLTIAQKIAAFTAKPNFSHNYSLNPVSNFVNPGVGGSINLYLNYVPIRSHEHYTELKKSNTNEQHGAGQESENNEVLNNELSGKLDPEIYKSFQHPKFVKTDTITFGNKRKKIEPEAEKPKKTKLSEAKISHNFQFF